MTSIIKVDNLQNQCGANIISESANVITIGASGDTVTLAAGASQSGFGRTGTVNWDTTPKTTTVTAVSGNGYFVNTTSGAITVNLPAGVAGSIVAVSDYANTAATNNITIDPNGTDKINGVNENAKITTNGASVTLIYVDATRGWKDVNDATLDVTGIPPFVAATGGTITCCGNYKIHTFTGPGTFTVTNAGTPAGSTTVDYLVVAGGGGGGKGNAPAHGAGGGGAGGFRESVPSPAAWTASPLASSTSLPVSVQGYPITVGAGGGAAPSITTAGVSGSNSVFSTITSAGGGGGAASGTSPFTTAPNGGSGGGGGSEGPTPGPNPSPAGGGSGGAGNTPPVAPPQGNQGGFGANGAAPTIRTGGGGGATAAGGNGPASAPVNGAGGAGATTSISGSPTSYAGGGGGGGTIGLATGGTGGTGGGGGGGSPGVPGTAGTTNRGGGGGGGHGGPGASCGGAGGSGIVVIRYKYQ